MASYERRNTDVVTFPFLLVPFLDYIFFNLYFVLGTVLLSFGF
jgi:hypothetical protein